MQLSREEALRAIIEYQLPIDSALESLSKYEWDCAAPIVTLTRDDMVKVLNRYLSGSISEAQLTDWADLIECREDIGCPERDEQLLHHIIYRIANPYLNENISKPLIASIVDELHA